MRIIAPVSSLESAKAVIEAGCDEIYCGVRMGGMKYISFNGRPASCSIPTYEELGKVVKLCHAHGVKVSLTANLPFMAGMIEKPVKDYLRKSVVQGIDALIVADIGALLLIKEMGINLPLYAGSYLVIRNSRAVRFFKKLNISRIIAPPDSTLEELESLVKENPGIEIEAFVHGEGCSNVGGNCYLLHSQRPPEEKFAPYDDAKVSDVVTGKKPLPEDFVSIHHRNPCLFYFDVSSINHQGKKQALGNFTILDHYVFCSLCALPKLRAIGIGGLKIVGRCNPPAFQDRTTRIYRKFIDLLEKEGNEKFKDELEIFKKNNPEMQLVCSKKRCYYQINSQKEVLKA